MDNQIGVGRYVTHLQKKIPELKLFIRIMQELQQQGMMDLGLQTGNM